MNTLKHSITVIITDTDMVKYQEQLMNFRAANEKHIIKEQIGCSMIPVPAANGQMTGLAIPYCIFECSCTEEQYKSWKFQQTLVK